MKKPDPAYGSNGGILGKSLAIVNHLNKELDTDNLINKERISGILIQLDALFQLALGGNSQVITKLKEHLSGLCAEPFDFNARVELSIKVDKILLLVKLIDIYGRMSETSETKDLKEEILRWMES